MVLAKYLRLALLGTALVASQAQATFDFNFCVSSCVHSSGCSTSDEKCVCKEARSILMDSVISCLYFNCKSDLSDFEDTFLEPIQKGCDDLPRSKIQAVESLASSYASKLPGATTAAEDDKDEPTPTPKTTSKPAATTAAKVTTEEEESAPSPTSTLDSDDAEETTPAADGTTPTETLITAPTSTGGTSSGGSGSDDSNGSGNTDPFGSPDSDSAAARPFVSLLGLSLAVGMLAIR
jgi:hypothetical protein